MITTDATNLVNELNAIPASSTSSKISQRIFTSLVSLDTSFAQNQIQPGVIQIAVQTYNSSLF